MERGSGTFFPMMLLFGVRRGERWGTKLANGSASSQIIRHLHGFRGFAIINIVAIHASAFATAGIPIEAEARSGVQMIKMVTQLLFHDSTIYFALISGLLFTLVLREKGWASFWRSKMMNVILPYVIITLLLTLLILRIGDHPRLFDKGVRAYLSLAGENTFTGGAIFYLWYIPVLTLLFAATPILAAIIHSVRFRWIVLPIVFLPLIWSRTFPDQSWGNVAYFMGAYAVGMVLGTNYDNAITIIRERAIMIAIFALISTILLAHSFATGWELLGWVSIRESLFYVQKLSMAGLALLWLKSIETRLPAWLDTLAAHAFAIYFLHGLFMFAFVSWTVRLWPASQSATFVFAAQTAYIVAALAGCTAITAFSQMLLGKHSRHILGA